MEKNKDPSYFKDWLRWRRGSMIILFLVSALVVTVFWNRIVVTVKSGEAAILWRLFSGTEIDKVYGEGLHIFSPFDTIYIYETRNQIALHDFDVISNKGLTIHLSLAIRYRPEYDLLGILHQNVGPDYLQRVITPQIESVMRKQLGQYTAEQIYTNEAGLLTNAILTALDEVGRNYIKVEDIIIRVIGLPEDIVTAIENKLKQEEHMKSYEFRIQTAAKEAERLKIEAIGIKNYHHTIGEAVSENTLRLKGIDATQELAKSNNAKVVIIGSGRDGLPIILNTDSAASPPSSPMNTSNPKETSTPPAQTPIPNVTQ